MSAQYLVFDGIAKRFDGLEVVAPVFDLDVAEGEVIVFLGPSGCGKSTLMRMVGGLETPSSGEIRLMGEPIRAPDRRRGMVCQSYSSFPWLTVAGNVEYGMRYRHDLKPAQKRARRDHYLAMVGLTEFADAYPNKVSGGMRQRVAIARTLAAGSEILLMDEPVGALDAQRREQLQAELRRIQHEDAKTVIFVTHDVEEAVFLADRIVIFSRRPARVVSILDIAAQLGPERTPELRDHADFFRLRREIARVMRDSVGVEP